MAGRLQAQAPDLIFHNGKVLTVDDRFTVTQAVAVKGERIMAAGSNAEIAKLAGAQTRKIDLKGKTISTMSYQDTTFYALLGLMASAGLTQNDVNVQQVGPVGVWQFVAEGKAQGMAGVPDWIPPVMAAGVKVKVIPTEEFFPHMAQGIAVSDQVIKEKPQMVQKFVTAALRGMKDIMDNPDKAADEFVQFVPEWKGKEGAVKFAFNMYAKDVYPGQATLGEVNAERLAKLQQELLESRLRMMKEGNYVYKPAPNGPLPERYVF